MSEYLVIKRDKCGLCDGHNKMLRNADGEPIIGWVYCICNKGYIETKVDLLEALEELEFREIRTRFNETVLEPSDTASGYLRLEGLRIRRL